MTIAPWIQRTLDSLSKSNKIVERSAALIVIAANGRFCQVTMTMAQRIVTLPVELCVFRFRKAGSAQAVCGVKWHLHSKEDGALLPHLCEKICALVQAHTIEISH